MEQDMSKVQDITEEQLDPSRTFVRQPEQIKSDLNQAATEGKPDVTAVDRAERGIDANLAAASDPLVSQGHPFEKPEFEIQDTTGGVKTPDFAGIPASGQGQS